MKKDQLKVLRGGLLDSAATSRKFFISAYITNTRLMGVLGMYIHFQLPDNETMRDLHQFFYFDAEEYGFESYQSILGNDQQRLEELENSLIGGLGGKKIPLNLREAQFLLQEYVRLNKKEKLPLPENEKEYHFLLEQDIFLTDPEKYILMCKQCTELTNPYELINYFLMRCFGKDFSAAHFLTTQNFRLERFSDFPAGTFCKNSIKESGEPGVYRCESLVELENNYYIAVTSLTVEQMRIRSYERISTLKITQAEAAMMLARSEFISVYELTDDPVLFSQSSTRLCRRAMETEHETGTLYMIFHPDNRHVAKKEYRLNEDVLGLYFVSLSGQLICAAYSLDEIHCLEADLATSPLRKSLLPISKYEFQEPVLYEFIQSGFDDFELFVDAIKAGE